MSDNHYSAFISYRHTERDTAAAEAVQKQLERFHIPASLQKKYRMEKIGRIFRDRDELVISEDLSRMIDEALAHSDKLIVICSPEYLESSWCLHEIEEFLKTHTHADILTVLSKGEPPSVFPEILRHAPDGTEIEPLACDYRGDIRKASRTELPRLAAALIGCGYDELIMRDTQYRRRRMLGIFGILAVLSAAAISYLLYSNRQIQKHYHETLIAQSGNLAEQSAQAYQAKDRYQAMRYAAEALPSETLDRPVTGEALQALSEAVYAYRLPYQITETEVYDLQEDITGMFLSDDGAYLALRDQADLLHVYDTGNGAETAQIPLYAAETDVILTQHGEIVTVREGTAYAFDMQGNLQAEMPMKYQLYNFLKESPDGTYIACGDSYAVQVMYAEDLSPCASFPLPDKTEGYIRDLCWSENGEKIAVMTRQEDGGNSFGVYDFATGQFTAVPGIYRNIRNMLVRDDGQLIVTADAEEESSYISAEGNVYLQESARNILAFGAEGERSWQTAVRYTAPDQGGDLRISKMGNEEVLWVTAGDHLAGIDPADGTITADLQITDTPLTITDITGSHIELVTSQGYRAGISADTGEVLLEQVFPPEITEIVYEQKNFRQHSRYYVLKDGNVMVYENFYDRELRLYEGEGRSEIPDQSLICGRYLLVKTGSTLTGYDTQTGRQIYEMTFDPTEAFVLLGNTGDTAVLLVISTDTGKIETLCMNTENGEISDRIALHMRDYYGDSGILDIYAQLYGEGDEAGAKRQMLETQYPLLSCAVLQGAKLYYHGYEEPDVIHVLDLLSREETMITPVLAAGQTLLDGIYPGDLSALSPSGTGYIRTCLSEPGQEVRSVLIREKDGETEITEESVSGTLRGVWNPKGSLYAESGNAEVLITDTAGTSISRIPYDGRSVQGMSWLHDDTLILCYPDGRLQNVSTQGELLHEVRMSYAERRYVGTESFRFAEDDRYLAVYCHDTLEMIDTAQWLSRPEVSVPGQVLQYLPQTHEIAVYSYLDGDPRMKRYAGVFPCRTVGDLITMADAQLAKMRRR